jgi:hypothetical protein
MKSHRTKEERQVIARRIFGALCTHYPDRYIALVERPEGAETTPDANAPSGANAIGAGARPETMP